VVNVTLWLLYPRERMLVPIFWIWPGCYGEEAYHVPLFEPRLITTSGIAAKGWSRRKYDDIIIIIYLVFQRSTRVDIELVIR
jgi:hypothetical protein